MSFNVRLFGYSGIIQVGQSHAQQYTGDAVFLNEEPCLWSQLLVCDGSTAATSARIATVPDGTQMVCVEVPDNHEIRYEVVQPGVAARAVSDSSRRGSGSFNLAWSAGYTLSIIDAAPVAVVPPAPTPATTFVGRSQGLAAGNSYTYAAAPIATNASDIIVVGVFAENVLNSPITGLTVGGVAMTQWATGNLTSLGTIRSKMAFFYGVPGAFATANIVVTTTGIGAPNATLLVWRLRGLNATPVAQASSASASSGSLSLGPIQANLGGAVIGISAADPVKSATETWSGSEAVTESTDAADFGNTTQIAGFYIDALTTASNSFAVTFSAGNTHFGGAISFGP